MVEDRFLQNWPSYNQVSTIVLLLSSAKALQIFSW